MAYPILGSPKPAFFDSSGDPLASGTITTLNPSNDAVKASYPTADDANASTNGTSGDITLDSRGEPTSTQYWGKDNEDYKVVIKDSAGTTIYTMDDIRMPAANRRTMVQLSGDNPSVAESNMFKMSATTITDFANGAVGDIIHVYGPASGASSITSSGTILTANGHDVRLVAGDSISFAMFVDQSWVEIGRSINSGAALFETVTGTNVIVENETGKTFFLNTAGGFTSTLPAPVNGLKFKFIVKTAPTTSGGYLVTTNGGDNVIFGTISDTTATTAANAEDTITFVFDTALVGDSAEFVSDGTNWYMTAQSQANGGITATAT
jgi:hypothetical protein